MSREPRMRTVFEPAPMVARAPRRTLAAQAAVVEARSARGASESRARGGETQANAVDDRSARVAGVIDAHSLVRPDEHGFWPVTDERVDPKDWILVLALANSQFKPQTFDRPRECVNWMEHECDARLCTFASFHSLIVCLGSGCVHTCLPGACDRQVQNAETITCELSGRQFDYIDCSPEFDQASSAPYCGEGLLQPDVRGAKQVYLIMRVEADKRRKLAKSAAKAAKAEQIERQSQLAALPLAAAAAAVASSSSSSAPASSAPAPAQALVASQPSQLSSCSAEIGHSLALTTVGQASLSTAAAAPVPAPRSRADRRRARQSSHALPPSSAKRQRVDRAQLEGQASALLSSLLRSGQQLPIEVRQLVARSVVDLWCGVVETPYYLEHKNQYRFPYHCYSSFIEMSDGLAFGAREFLPRVPQLEDALVSRKEVIRASNRCQQHRGDAASRPPAPRYKPIKVTRATTFLKTCLHQIASA